MNRRINREKKFILIYHSLLAFHQHQGVVNVHLEIFDEIDYKKKRIDNGINESHSYTVVKRQFLMMLLQVILIHLYFAPMTMVNKSENLPLNSLIADVSLEFSIKQKQKQIDFLFSSLFKNLLVSLLM